MFLDNRARGDRPIGNGAEVSRVCVGATVVLKNLKKKRLTTDRKCDILVLEHVVS